MNALQNEQKPEISRSKKSLVTDLPFDLIGRAKPIGTFAGVTGLILRFEKGKLVPADTGDQGGGQN